MQRGAARWLLVVGWLVVGMLSTNRSATACATGAGASRSGSSCCGVEPMAECCCCPTVVADTVEAAPPPGRLVPIGTSPATTVAAAEPGRSPSCVCRSGVPLAPAPRPANLPSGRGHDRWHTPDPVTLSLSAGLSLRVSLDRLLRIDPAPATLAFSTTVRLLL